MIRSKTRYDVHSPFIYNFITEVLEDARHYYAFDEIEYLRDQLLNDATFIHVEDKGAGSHKTKRAERQVKEIAATSLSTQKFGELLFRMVNHFQSTNILELGTSLGISALYLAKGNVSGHVTTIEGSEQIGARAKSLLTASGQQNITLIVDEFSHAIETAFSKVNDRFDLIYIDGNHQLEPTIHYFEYLLKHHSLPETIFIFDDIHWSRGMESAWRHVQNHAQVTCTVDLFFKGIAFTHHGFHAKQQLSLKY